MQVWSHPRGSGLPGDASCLTSHPLNPHVSHVSIRAQLSPSRRCTTIGELNFAFVQWERFHCFDATIQDMREARLQREREGDLRTYSQTERPFPTFYIHYSGYLLPTVHTHLALLYEKSIRHELRQSQCRAFNYEVPHHTTQRIKCSSNIDLPLCIRRRIAQFA
jgi:hypothetical protein